MESRYVKSFHANYQRWLELESIKLCFISKTEMCEFGMVKCFAFGLTRKYKKKMVCTSQLP